MNQNNEMSRDNSNIQLKIHSEMEINMSQSINVSHRERSSSSKYDVKSDDKKNRSEKQTYRFIRIFSFSLFVIIVMIISITVVCLTTLKSKYSCQSSFTSILNWSSDAYDSHPYAITTGDFNDNHLIDIAVVNSGTNTIGIFLDLVNTTSISQMTISTGDNSKPIAISSADLNNDTYLDLVVTNYDAHNIGIFFGYGNGTFSKQETIFVGISRPLSITINDLNNDNYFDLITTNNGTNSIGIFIGYGNGKFHDEIIYFTGYDSLPYSTVVDDFNNDNNRDIAVTNYGTNNVMIFLGDGHGNFSIPLIFSTGPQSQPCSIVTSDFNHDGYVDIAVANSGKHTIGIFLGRGNAHFTSQITYFISPESSPRSIALADFNKDNQFDIVVCNSYANSLSIFIGYGNGSFATPTMHSTGIDSGPMGLTIDDFDNDNSSDIAVANLATNNIIVLIKYSMIQSQQPTSYPAEYGSVPYQILMGDFNNDIKLDLVIVNYGTSNIGVYLGHGNGSFSNETTYSTSDNSHPRAMAMDDLDKDSNLDIITANYNTQSLSILYGYGNGSFTIAKTLSTGSSSSPRSVVIDYFNDDNYLDIVFADYGGNMLGILFGYSNRVFSNLTKFSAGNNARPIALAVADFNNDHSPDLVVANYGTDSVTIFLGSKNGTFQMFNTYELGGSSLPRMITIADLNCDNYLDIIIANYGTNSISIFFGLGNMSFSTQVIYSTGWGSGPIWVNIADLNSDGYLDIVVANQKLNNLGVFIGNGHGNFSNQSIYSTGPNSSPYALAIGDYNRDEQLDIAIANVGTDSVVVLLGHPIKTTNSDSLRLGDYYAEFQYGKIYSTGSTARPYSMSIADMNNDTYLDIIITNSKSENIEIFLGNINETYISALNYSIGDGSYPQGILVADFNQDNLMDVVVTNSRYDNIVLLLGYHQEIFPTKITYSTGLQSYPVALAMDNFNDDIYIDLVVANMESNNIGVFFGFDYTFFDKLEPCDCGESSGPYSVAIGDVNNDGYLDMVSALFGLNSIGVFLGYGNGSFSSLAIVSRVPSSRAWCITVGDFNNDNKLDIATANNGIDSIGVLLGYGNGSFTPSIEYYISPNARPIYVTVGDLNNDSFSDIIAANYGGDSIDILFGYGNGSFQPLMILSSGQGSLPRSVGIFDVNNDGRFDIITVNQGLNQVGIFLGLGNGSFQSQLTFPTGDNSFPRYATAGDFNHDGYLDIAVANYASASISILYGLGNGTFDNLHFYSTGTSSKPTNLMIADINRDNQLDIIIADETSTNVGIFFAYEDGTFSTISTFSIGQGVVIYSVAVADFNGDNYTDFAMVDVGYNAIRVFLSSGSKPFGGQATFSTGNYSGPSSISTADFNNDQYLDIAVTNYYANNLAILFGNGNYDFSNLTLYSTGADSKPKSSVVNDFNNDSFLDIIVVNSNTNNIIVFIGHVDGTFSKLISYRMGDSSQPVSIAAGDFNRDYLLDIAVANSGTNNVQLLLGYGNGTFTNQTSYPSTFDSAPNWIIFNDLNNDGWDDIAVVFSGDDSIKILWNRC